MAATVNGYEESGFSSPEELEAIKHNILLEQTKEMFMLAKQELHSAQYAKIKNAAVSREQCQQAGMEVMERQT